MIREVIQRATSCFVNDNSESTEVVIISFPKCGRTWLRLMLGRVIQLHLDLQEVRHRHAKYHDGLPDLVNAPVLDLHQLTTRCSSIPNITLSHDDGPFWKKPDELVESKTQYKNKKVILLVRDPRDVVVSSYFEKIKRVHVYSDKEPYEGTLSDYLHEPVGSFDTILRFYNIWAEKCHTPRDFLLIRYEDMHVNPRNELRRVLDFIGLHTVNNEQVFEATRFASFENMRKMEEMDALNSFRLRPGDKNDEESYKTRKGKVGGFFDYLTQDEIEYLNRRMSELLTDFYGYKPTFLNRDRR